MEESGSGESAVPALEPVQDHLLALQDRICEAIESVDGEARFVRQEIEREGGGRSRPRVLSDGPHVERAAVNYSHTVGNRMPPAATERRPELSGGRYQAVSVSLIVHPRNPYAPTSHANFRFFIAQPPAGAADDSPVWWFGGGFDLTPYYGFEEDVCHWHRVAREACVPLGEDVYPALKKACDAYFYLPHREEARGVGGLFFDDFDRGGFDASFDFVKRASFAYLDAYVPILEKRKDAPYGERERDFQLYRRGRYVEFNLLHDRGTKFGLQAAARTESVLASLPPLVAWRYDWRPEPGTPEARLYTDFLPPRDWI